MPKSGPMISIVDDDVSVRRALRRLVGTAGYLVETFASGPEFLRSAPSTRTACLVLDIYLEGMTGFVTDWLASWERATLTAEQVLDAGDRVVVIAVWRGRGRASGVAAE